MTTKLDLTRMTAKASHRYAMDCAPVIEGFLKEITHRLEQGRTIEIRGFGTFYTAKQKERQARNPKTGVPVTIPERLTARMKFSPEMRIK